MLVFLLLHLSEPACIEGKFFIESNSERAFCLSYSDKWYLRLIDEVIPFSVVHGMRFIFDNQNNVSCGNRMKRGMRVLPVLTRDLVGSLVSIVWECDPGSLFPTSLYRNGEYLLSHAGGLAVIIQHLGEKGKEGGKEGGRERRREGKKERGKEGGREGRKEGGKEGGREGEGWRESE